MRWLSTFLALALTGALQANALEASIFSLSPRSSGINNANAKQQRLTEEEAQLVLELRMKSSVASVLGMVDTDTVHRLNQFAKADFTLFGGSSSDEAPGRSVFILEGVDERVAMTLHKVQPNHIFVPQISTTFMGADLMGSFIESTPTVTADRGQYCAYYDNDASKSTSVKPQTARECLSKDPLARDSELLNQDFLKLVDSVETWASKSQENSALKLSFKTDSGDSLLASKTLQSLIRQLAQTSSTGEREITAIILPRGLQSKPLSRQDVNQQSGSIAKQDTFKRSTQPLQSTLAPVCHASNSSCAEATNNCSGHGSCYLKYGSGVEGTTGNCYACQCQQSVIRNSDGTTKTVQWGGSACQKRDISSPFFLVAGVSLLAIVLVGSAIGMLFSMGSQELPSVISAGVGAPKTQM
ncbi:hypothetical protein N7499_008571 [Penicillium canescens]|uniref:Vacuolar sorting protein Vps3844 C-terminal domain-containing protein n=1 Tax=Penicillium canescens TaxID=5083 RepID=A0AAD6N289_PENCN|nr:uncharacterized protein N7446_013607 [Penicillium canescens]KAJ5985151.1 hypothetical protein N7522_012347 [Penicillium canescens]KAJ6023247.1 hypothetical protein N7460_013642 [Penicillium canescens]KAJ6025483.1 hypothetical protein N7444_013162 [Penicillium canescens]KAJ6042541.1 hypothetical protein N7446_013607 [Penicillium canescens]KAJ6076590.1 hypothetical protein N7499_008571 [Penicillium canescens]